MVMTLGVRWWMDECFTMDSMANNSTDAQAGGVWRRRFAGREKAAAGESRVGAGASLVRYVSQCSTHPPLHVHIARPTCCLKGRGRAPQCAAASCTRAKEYRRRCYYGRPYSQYLQTWLSPMQMQR